MTERDDPACYTPSSNRGLMAPAKRELFKSLDVCEMAQLQPYVLRSWESEFPGLGQSAGAAGGRLDRRADVEMVLRIKQLVFAGVTTEVCVQTTMREANDRGYECLLAEEATESYFPEFKAAARAMIRAQGAIVGWTAHVDDILESIAHA